MWPFKLLRIPVNWKAMEDNKIINFYFCEMESWLILYISYTQILSIYIFLNVELNFKECLVFPGGSCGETNKKIQHFLLNVKQLIFLKIVMYLPTSKSKFERFVSELLKWLY